MESHIKSQGGQPQYIAVDNKSILQDCASVSSVFIGNFSTTNPNKKEAVFLRGQDTIELYDFTSSKFNYIAKYHLENAKCLEMTTIKLTWKNKDVVVLLLPKDKLLTLEFDPEVAEFKILAMHNFENQQEFKVHGSGKAFPFRGRLKSINSYYTSLFGYITDDSTFAWVELRQAVMPELNKRPSNHNQLTQHIEKERENTKKLNQDYLNAWGENIEAYFKPARFRNLYTMGKIQSIIDIELIEQSQSNQTFLYVLHQSNFDKTIGTITRQPISMLSIFEIVQENKESTELVHTMTVDFISYYARSISKSFPQDDFAYVIGACGLYVIRADKQKFTFVRTSQMAPFLDSLDSPPSSKTMQPTDPVLSVKDKIDARIELKFDGCTRVQTLPGRRMIIIKENGQIYMMQLIFDQAEIDLTDAIFTQIRCDQSVTPSIVKQTSLTFLQIQLCSKSDDSWHLLVSSYYQDQSLFTLIEKSGEQAALQKKQKTDEAGSQFMKAKMEITYNIVLEDTLTTIAPITDVIALEGNDKKDMDLIVASGYHLRSYLTFVKEGIPFDSRVLNQDIQGIQRVFTVRDRKQQNSFDKFAVVAQQSQTFVLQIGAGSMEEVDKTKSDFIMDETTIQCLSVGLQSPQRILQATPSHLNLLGFDGKLLKRVSIKEEFNQQIISCSKEYLEGTDLVIIMLSDGSLKAFSTQTLKQEYKQACDTLETQTLQLTAFSTATINQSKDLILNLIGDYLILAYQSKGMIRVYSIDEHRDLMTKIYEVKHATELLPILPNCIENKHSDLINRSITDLSVQLQNDYHIQEIHKEKMYIQELHLKQLEQKTVLILMLSNGKILAYENIDTFASIRKEKLRFKLIQQQNLMKRITDWSDLDFKLSEASLPQNIVVDGNQIFIIQPESSPILISQRKRKLYFHKMKRSQFIINSLAPYSQQGQPKGSCYLYVDQIKQTLSIMKIPLIFDPKFAPKLIDNYVIKQTIFQGKALKKLTLHTDSTTNQEYLMMTVFSNGPTEQIKEESFSLSSNMKDDQKAPGIYYEIQAALLPREGQWKAYTTNFDAQNIMKMQLKVDEVILCLENVRLLLNDDVSFKNYITVSSMKIDSKVLEEDFYKSFLYLLEIEPHEKRLKLNCLERFSGPITFISDYQGHLMVAQKTQKLIRDHAIVFYRYNEQSPSFKSQIQPSSVENMATHISTDGDLIFVGDAYKNLRIMWVCDKEELKKENIEDTRNIFKLNHLFSNVMDTRIAGVFTLRVDEDLIQNQYSRLSQVERQLLTLFTMSEEGYLRLFQLRERKLLECIAQINIQDRITKVVQLKNLGQDNQKRFIIVSKHGGLKIVTTVPEPEYLGLESLLDIISRSLPHKGGLTPLHYHKTPQAPRKEVTSITQRLNENAIDKSTIQTFYWMSYNMQRAIAEKVGYSVATLHNCMAFE